MVCEHAHRTGPARCEGACESAADVHPTRDGHSFELGVGRQLPQVGYQLPWWVECSLAWRVDRSLGGLKAPLVSRELPWWVATARFVGYQLSWWIISSLRDGLRQLPGWIDATSLVGYQLPLWVQSFLGG
jgi:hypothetical protein